MRLVSIARWLLSLALLFGGCSTTDERVLSYIAQHPDLSVEIKVALQNGVVVNGMLIEEVELLLGKPKFIEQKQNKQRWIYRGSISGIAKDEAYAPPGAFSQGIGFVIPLHYRAREIRIDFESDTVTRIEEIISF